MQVANRKPIFQVVGCASLLQVCLSLVQGVNVDVYLRRLGRGLSCSSCAIVCCSDIVSLTDIGTGRGYAAHFGAERSFHVLELSNRSTAPIWQKHVAHLRREHKRARADLQLADQDTSKYGTKGDCPRWDVAFASALRRKIKSGMGATVLTGLLQIDVCQQSTGVWEIRADA